MVRTERTSSAMSRPTRLPSTVGTLSTLFLNRDMAIFEDYTNTYAVPRLKFVVADCQHMRVPVTVGSFAHEDAMQLFWPPFDGEHVVF